MRWYFSMYDGMFHITDEKGNELGVEESFDMMVARMVELGYNK